MPILKLANKNTYRYILLIVATLLFGLYMQNTAIKVFAKDKCEEISDLDNRAKCYEEKIEDKQDEYESTSKKLEDIRDKKNDISSKISGYLEKLSVTQAEIDDLQAEITQVVKELDQINELLTDRKTQLAEKTSFRNKVVRNYAKQNFKSDLEMIFAYNPLDTGLTGFQYSTYTYIFGKSLADEAKRLIYLLNSEIDSYETDRREAQTLKTDLQDTQNELLSLKADIDTKKADAQDEFGNLESKEGDYVKELGNLEDEIAELSSKQQAIINQKYGTESGSVGDYEPTAAKTPNPPFKPAFAAFSYGAYTHYKGMSQYGAKGRADAGKNYKDILKFYYKEGITKKSMDEICVEGQGNMDFSDYLYGIAEMPSSWDSDALKAQAVAARSYAYRYAKAGKCICTSQSCQVFLESKSDKPPESWKKAVDDTEGEILEGDVVAYYSSTTGGYIQDIGWDTKCGGSGCWPRDAYEKIGGSPWFRKAWYTKSYNDSSDCGRSHPWLTEEEMADIINAWRVWSSGSGSEKDHITPVTTSCWGGDPYSIKEMREKADKYGKAYSKVKSIKVDVGNNGYTSQVILEADGETVKIDGQTFKTVYNLRAPSYVAIRSRLFDFEKED